MTTDVTLRIRVQLQRVRPVVWRRIEVPGSISLDRLHTVVHVAMGWSGIDGYEFSVGRSSRDPWRTTFSAADQFASLHGAPTRAVRPTFDAVDEPDPNVSEVLRAPGDVLLYRYGLAWEHRLRLERVLAGESRPRCLAGRRAVPPNYLLNSWNYSALVCTAHALAAGVQDDDAAVWLAGHFPGLSPAEVVSTLEAFDAEEADAILEALN